MMNVTTGKLQDAEKVDVLGKGIFEDETKSIANSMVKDAVANKRFSGKLKEAFSYQDGKQQVVLVGLGKKNEYTLERMRKAVARFTKLANSRKFTTAALTIHLETVKEADLLVKSQEATVAALLSTYKFDQYKTDKKEEPQLGRLLLIADSDKATVERGIKAGKVIAKAVTKARDLGNTPANILNPATFEAIAKKIAKENKLSFSSIQAKELEKKGMNLILAVGNASSVPPRMVKVVYEPKKKGKDMKTIALVGKGITFDTGGLNLKPSQWMDYMKSDMCGAAGMLEIIAAAKQMNLPHKIITILALAENSVSAPAMRPGDVYKGYGGKTVEILNTDAEGRLVLADAVAWAEKMKPDLIIDMATLTGASISHLGYEGSAIVGTADKEIKVLEKAGLETYERIWKMPIWEEFDELIKADIADVRNLSKPTGREAGVITGGLFMKQFIKDTSWIHIDIGNMSWFPEARDYHPKQATGWGIRLLIRFLEKYR